MEISKHVTSAFRLAHRASEDGRYDAAARSVFRAIARELWNAHGKIAGEPAAAAEVAGE